MDYDVFGEINELIASANHTAMELNRIKGYIMGLGAVGERTTHSNSNTIKFRDLIDNTFKTSENRASDRGEETFTVPEGSISLRKDGRWMGKYYDEGKRKSLYARTKKECMLKLKEAIENKNKMPSASNELSKNMTFDKAWSHWYETYKLPKLKTSSAIILKRYYNYHIKKVLGSIGLNKIKGIDIQRLLNNVESENSRKKCYDQLNDFFNVMNKNQLVNNNPMSAVELNINKKKETKRSITYEEEKQLELCFKDYWMHNLVFLILYTGMRKGEALALTWEDIDFEKNTITINKAYDRFTNSTTTPKSYSSIRTIPLFAKAKENLLTLKTESSTGEIFTQCKANVGELFKKKLKQSTLSTDITLHALRHTFATRLMEAGIPDKIRQAWLGHSSVEITNKIYTHVNDYFEIEEVKKATTYFENNTFDTHFDTHSNPNKN